ncbi:MAG: transposase [Caulobacteraceae bacterium]
MMPGDDVLPKPVARRVEVFTGSGRRRRWSVEAKARIVAESYATSVGEVADQYGLSKTQLFTWRRDARSGGAEAPQEPIFAPVVLAALAEAAPPRSDPKPKKGRRTRPGGIELEIDGVVVRVERGAEARTVAAVIQALKRAR